MACSCAQLEQRLNELSLLVYTKAFKKELSGLTAYIKPKEHKLYYITGWIVVDPDGTVVNVTGRIFPDQGLQLKSNVSLNGHTLILY